jgi:predicted ArsR family transcriptional regulator
MEEDIGNKIIQSLISGPATAPEIAKALGTSENDVLPALDKLRAGHVIEFMAGEWSLTGQFRDKVWASSSER